MKQYENATPWCVGTLLLTPTTRKWTPEARRKAMDEERRRVFANFDLSDNGISRTLIARCETEQQAKTVADTQSTILAQRNALAEALKAIGESSRFDPGHTNSFDSKTACSRMRDMRRIANAALASLEETQ